MRTRTCAAFIFDGFADHQLSLAMSCLRRTGSFVLETFSNRGQLVVSSSGLRVMPHTSLLCMNPDEFDILVLPGGDQWEKGDNLEIFPLIMKLFNRHPRTSMALMHGCNGPVPLIAIGEATLALADLGLLDHIPHTGPGPEYFEQLCTDYTGAPWFRDQGCVAAGTIVTMQGMASDHGMLGLFDTLQEIYVKNHELLDPAC